MRAHFRPHPPLRGSLSLERERERAKNEFRICELAVTRIRSCITDERPFASWTGMIIDRPYREE
jgi:hypothetical protein